MIDSPPELKLRLKCQVSTQAGATGSPTEPGPHRALNETTEHQHLPLLSRINPTLSSQCVYPTFPLFHRPHSIPVKKPCLPVHYNSLSTHPSVLYPPLSSPLLCLEVRSHEAQACLELYVSKGDPEFLVPPTIPAPSLLPKC